MYRKHLRIESIYCLEERNLRCKVPRVDNFTCKLPSDSWDAQFCDLRVPPKAI